MIRSMTGFGSASEQVEGATVTVELRSVNARHLKLALRLPEGSDGWEPEIRKRISERLARGYVEVRVGVVEGAGRPPELEVDARRADAFLEAIERLRARYELAGEPDLSLLLQFGGVLVERSRSALELVAPTEVGAVVDRALEKLVQMREGEGERLQADLRERLAGLRVGVDAAADRAPARLDRERERLRSAVAELVDGPTLDEDRLAREIALIADRWDIGEEIVRIRSHLDAFEEYLGQPADEPVGKRLSFLVQELQRETNTLGAKANDSEITRVVVELKNDVERLREQVENVE